jgi:hypothetical protein
MKAKIIIFMTSFILGLGFLNSSYQFSQLTFETQKVEASG